MNTINSSLRNGTWEKKEINADIDALDVTAIQLAEKGTVQQFLVKMRNEISNIDRFTNRIQDIKESRFIHAAYAVADGYWDGDTHTSFYKNRSVF